MTTLTTAPAETKEYTKKIPLALLKKDGFTVVPINEKLKALIYYDGDTLKVISDVCPHMGGALAHGWMCPKEMTIKCSWHGYKFDVSTLELLENPNEEIWTKPLVGEREACKFKTPKYRLRELKFKTDKDFIYI